MPTQNSIANAINALAVAQDSELRYMYIGSIESQEDFDNIEVENGLSFNFTYEEVLTKSLEFEYVANRKNEYPSIGDQLDMLYHDIKAGTLETGDWITAIEQVKTDNPKPSE